MNNLHPVLDSILDKKRHTIAHRKTILPIGKILKDIELKKKEHRNFLNSIKQDKKISIIAECKRATPSMGIIREKYNLEKILLEYQKNDIAAISILTEEHFFHGDLYHLFQAKKTVFLPVLRKDFIIDKYQIFESLFFGADAILLIKKILTKKEMLEFYTIARDLGLEVIFEVTNKDEIEEVLELNPKIIGLNNRDLETFEVDVYKTLKLRKYVPENICLISESGIKSKSDMELLKTANVDAVLIGTLFMQSNNITQTINSLRN